MIYIKEHSIHGYLFDYHENIIYICERPFANVQEMNRTMIDNWNNVVTDEDIVYHLGDFSFGSFEETKQIVNELNGRICLIMGNHDRPHSVEWWQKCGFYRVYDKPILIEGFYLLSHEPLDWSDDKSNVFAQIYGHVHNRPEFKTVTARTHNVSVEVIGYTPVLLNDVYKEMMEAEHLIQF